MNRYLRGAIAGVVATGVMTMVISAGQRLSLLHTPPPTQITSAATSAVANRVGIDPEPPESGFNTGALAAHAGFGAIAGALYVAAKPILPSSRSAAGAIWGGAIWASAYGGYLPALRLYPWPDDDRHSRTAVMIAAHIVYGVTLTEAEQWLASGS